MPAIKTKLNENFIRHIMNVFINFNWNGMDFATYMKHGFTDDEDFLKNNLTVNFFKILGYSDNDFDEERTISTGRFDKIIKNRNHKPIIVVEAKNSSHREFNYNDKFNQLFPYMDELNTPIGILTNGFIFEIYLKANKNRDLYVSINFLEIFEKYIRGIENLTEGDWSKLVKLKLITREVQDFSEEDLYKEPQLDVAKDTYFDELIDDIQEAIDLISWDIKSRIEYYKKIYGEKIFPHKSNQNKMTQLRRQFREVFIYQTTYKKWLKYNKREHEANSINQFISETLYTFLNRVLLIRICEDKGIQTRRISDGGIESFKKYVGSDVNYNSMLKIAYDMMKKLYFHLYQDGIYDWYIPDNEVAFKVIYWLNKYNFKNVNRDILGKLYEKYIDKDERKRLGQFYTPDEVVICILDTINYTVSNGIDGKLVLDPACGSGGFLVPVVNRLVTKYKNIGWDAETILNKVQQLVYGFDINAFAVHIAEMNILFQLIDLIAEARQKNPEFILPRLNIFVTDSLIIPTGEQQLTLAENMDILTTYEDDKQIVKDIKLKQNNFKNGFDYIIGNPPYGLKFTDSQKAYLTSIYPNVSDHESSQYFTILSLNLLAPGGSLGFIIPNTFSLNVFAKKFRMHLLKNSKNFVFIDMSLLSVFKDAKVRNGVICTNCLNDNNINKLLALRAYDTNNDSFDMVECDIFEYKQLLEEDDLWVRISKYDTRVEKLISVIQTNSELLTDKFEASQGLIPYDKYAGHDEETIKSRKWHNTYKVDDTYKKELKGADVLRYYIEWNGSMWISYGDWLAHPRDKKFFIRPRILVREITNDKNGLINAAYTDEELYNNPSIINIINKNDSTDDLYYLLGILNSKMMAFYHANTSPKARKGLFPKILVKDIRKIPIKWNDQYKQDIINSVKEIERNIGLLKKITAKLNNPYAISKEKSIKIVNLSNTKGLLKRIIVKKVVGNIKQIEVVDKIINITKDFKIEFNNKYAATCIAHFIRYLANDLKGKSQREIDNILLVPEDNEQIMLFLSGLKKINEEKEHYFQSLNELQHKIDEYVYKVYGIDSECQNLIEQAVTN